MKIAVIVVGSHFSGKSRTIKEFLKPLLGLTSHQQIFEHHGKTGRILSQSFEESRSDANEKIARYSHYDLLVIAARPESESVTQLLAVEKLLTKYKFKHHRVVIDADPTDSYCKRKAKEILGLLDA